MKRGLVFVLVISVLFLAPSIFAQGISDGDTESLCKYSCDLDGSGTCVGEGYRTAIGYCDFENYDFLPQKLEGAVCTEHYECAENICVSGECGGKGFFGKTIERIGGWFGFGASKPALKSTTASETFGNSFAECPDFDSSGKVDFQDFIAFNAGYNKPVTKGTEKFDLNSDGEIEFNDFIIFSRKWDLVCSVGLGKNIIISVITEKESYASGEVIRLQ